MSIWSAEIKELNQIYQSVKGTIPILEKELAKLVTSDDENMLLVYSRRCLEVIITELCEQELKRDRGSEPLQGIIDKLNKGKIVPHNIIVSMQGVNSMSTFGAHPKEFETEQVKPVLNNLTIIVKWYLKYKGIEIPKGVTGSENKVNYVESGIKVIKGIEKDIKPGSAGPTKLKLSRTGLIVIIIIAGIFFYQKFFTKTDKTIGEKSIAVMTFKNLTGDTTNNYLAEMQHEALYQELGKISQVKPLRIVGPRTTSVIEMNRKTVSEIARAANVDYIVEGSLINTGVVEEILVRLIQVLPDENLIWDENYTGDRKNILRLYNSIADLITQKIGLGLSPQDQLKLPKPGIVNPRSYEAYARGMTELEKYTDEGMKKGLEYLNEAVDIAPDDPFANAGLALGYLTIAHSPLDQGDALEKGEGFAYKALSLDPTIAQVHAALAEAYLYNSWNFVEAEKHFKEALKIDPNLDMAHYHYSWALCLWGRLDEAITEHRLAQKYDPYNPLHTAWLGDLYVRAGKYDDAIEAAQETFKIEKDYPIGYFVLAEAYLKKGMNEEAIVAAKKLVEIVPEFSYFLGIIYAKAGHREEAVKILNELESQPVIPFFAQALSKLNAVLGNKDEAFKWLAYEPHHAWVAWDAVSEDYESLHNDPRWKVFLDRLNLPEK